MRGDTKRLLSSLIAEGLLLESIIWCGTNHWKVNPFLAGNVVFFAVVGSIVVFVLFIIWALERS